MLQYILLARHGAVDRAYKISDKDKGIKDVERNIQQVASAPVDLLAGQPEEQRIDIKPDKDQGLKDGGSDILEVAATLADLLSMQPRGHGIIIGKIWHGSYRQVRETANILRQAVTLSGREITPEQKEALDPDKFWDTTKPGALKEFVQRLLNIEHTPVPSGKDSIQPNAILVVGHAPHLGWIAESILRHPTPIHRAELVCIAMSDRRIDQLLRRDRWLLWTIAPSDDETTKQLREKIESKMRLAGVLGGVITGLLVFLLGVTLKDQSVSNLDDASRTNVYLSLGSFLVALGLYLATVYAYDRLLMPVRFWAERADPIERHWLVKRPPSSATWVLYQNMIRVWTWMFTPATWAVGLGILFLAAAVFHPAPITSLVGIALLIVFAWYYRHFRPVLGTED